MWFYIDNCAGISYIYNNDSGILSKLPSDINFNDLVSQISAIEPTEHKRHFTPQQYLDDKKTTRLMLFLTSACNLNCVYCHCNSDITGDGMSEDFAIEIVKKYIIAP
jgi:sulfatase maturation enzyme AslB (radical SAM superfamily)